MFKNITGKILSDLSPAAHGYISGRMSRRQFISSCTAAGICFSSPYFLLGCSQESDQQQKVNSSTADHFTLDSSSDQYHFLKDVGGGFSSTKLRVVSENTPAARVTKNLIEKEFTPLTGISVEWELLSLERVLAKIIADCSRKAGTHDLFYIDQAWLGDIFQECIPPLELMDKSDFAYPEYDLDDILSPLLEHVASYQNELFGIPFDIPIFILMYRKDIFNKLGLSVPTSLAEYLDVARNINRYMAPEIYGTTGMWKPGHYGLECNMTAWLWGHGGSVFNSDNQPVINDDRAREALEYMLQLGQYMPPGVTSWDWNGESTSFAQGKVGLYLSWGEFFPSYDDPQQSKIVGLAEAAPPPLAKKLRSPQDCGFGEIPGIAHQGGSSLAVSRHSASPDAAWILLQWATSSDITTRACLMGGGSSPIRTSNYNDARVKDKARITPGTTRHFNAVLEAIYFHMGTEPRLPGWAGLATKGFAAELGKMVTMQQSVKTTLDRMQAAAWHTLSTF